MLENQDKHLTFFMPKPTPHKRNQSSYLQRKSVEWSQYKKSVDMKKTNSNEISQPLNFNLSTTTTSVGSSVECCTKVIVMSSDKQLIATTYKYSNNNNNK